MIWMNGRGMVVAKVKEGCWWFYRALCGRHYGRVKMLLSERVDSRCQRVFYPDIDWNNCTIRRRKDGKLYLDFAKKGRDKNLYLVLSAIPRGSRYFVGGMGHIEIPCSQKSPRMVPFIMAQDRESDTEMGALNAQWDVSVIKLKPNDARTPLVFSTVWDDGRDRTSIIYLVQFTDQDGWRIWEKDPKDIKTVYDELGLEMPFGVIESERHPAKRQPSRIEIIKDQWIRVPGRDHEYWG